MKKTFICVSTKGGPGKTTMATQVLPIVLAGKSKQQITIYSLDDNNTHGVKSAYIKFNQLKMKDTEDVLDEVELLNLCKNDTVNIIDAGGGNDTLHLLKIIKKTRIKGIHYVIPITDDIDQIHNLRETISSIKKASDDAVIHLILNRVYTLDEDKIKEQFLGVFGSKKYMIKAMPSELSNDIQGVYFVPGTPIFSILKNVYKTTLLDSYYEAEDLLDDLESKKSQWVLEGADVFNKNNAQVRLADDVIKLVDKLQPLKQIIEG